jgi:hypothetical protein
VPPPSPSHTHTAHQHHRHFLFLSHPVLKIQRGRRTPIAPLASSPRLFPSPSSASRLCLCRARSHRFRRNFHCRCRSAMGRSSRACSLLGSPLLLLLLSLGCATAQNASTWTTLSGKLDSPRFPSLLFLDKFRSIMRTWFCLAVWAGSLGRLDESRRGGAVLLAQASILFSA